MKADLIKTYNQDDAISFIRPNAFRPASGIAVEVQRRK
jgi:hypothetical protein